MLKLNRILGLLILSALFTGCTTTTITNLTPSTLPRNPDNLYMLEMELTSNQQSLRRDSIKTYVTVGFDFYPMQRGQLLSNRWEALVPVAPDQNILHYRFKVDYDYNDFGKRGQGSTMSTEYRLTIKD